eukprot:GHVU01164807.1.p1 GENE.GHVU01164807.1~~GHVU01164807.1.p1  ORF type:complete len:105 (+),score=14.48 GHVU01164807.1:106-420(+)
MPLHARLRVSTTKLLIIIIIQLSPLKLTADSVWQSRPVTAASAPSQQKSNRHGAAGNPSERSHGDAMKGAAPERNECMHAIETACENECMHAIKTACENECKNE